MRILYLHQYFAPPSGAVGTRSYETARRLIDNGHTVHIITSAAMLPEPHRSMRHTRTLEFNGIPVTVIPVPYANEMSFATRIRAFFSFAVQASIQAARQPADIVFATSTPLTIALPGIVARLAHRVPMVFEVRDLWPELPIAVGALRNPVLRMLARGLEWIAYHAAAHIVALSPGMAEGVQQRGIPAERITVLPNSCDVAMFDIPAERGDPIREKLALAPDQPLIVYSGAFGRINGVDYLVELAAHTREIDPDVRFLLLGKGAEHAQIVAQAREHGVLERNLWLWEPIPKTELAKVLAAATVATSVFINLPAMWNNSANKFFDALAARKPVVINYQGWQADLLHATGAGIVLPPDDPQAAAQQLINFVRDTERLKCASEAAHQLAYTRFLRDDMVRQLDELLTRVAQAK